MAAHRNGKTPTKAPKTNGNGPTPAQQRARREYVKMTGHKISKERVEKIRSQWSGFAA